ncbi:MAG: MBL fold metallo-hydrolase [Bacteroidia bacterium]|nr:MBL fold metallo-hydrolase [Bacteroidia bacterium]MCZ2278005.1 MBL fold metallo-hydrolase [Bacteroidia bacterium]
MISVQSFTFNPFAENTYILYDETRECCIIDPGCYENHEKKILEDFIRSSQLKPVRLVNTHCHIDHVLGNRFITDTWKLQLEIHLLEIPLLRAVSEYGPQYGIYCDPIPELFGYLSEADIVKFGNSVLEVVHTPGHSPGSISFISRADKFVLAGDVLFQLSIGRTDLPGGDYQTLINSILTKLYPLPDDYTVYSGHGPETNIGFEKKNNPFVTG